MRKLAIFCLLAFPLPANAGMLLLELGWENPKPVTLPATYTFTIGNPIGGSQRPGDGSGAWVEEVTAFPHNSAASAELVARFNYLIALYDWSPGGGPNYDHHPLVGLSNGGQYPEAPELCTSCYWLRLVANEDDTWRTGPEWRAFAESVGWDVTLHVPLLGQGLRGYDLTDIERSVTAAKQTIRLYGVIVPEPNATALAAALGAMLAALLLYHHRVLRK